MCKQISSHLKMKLPLNYSLKNPLAIPQHSLTNPVSSEHVNSCLSKGSMPRVRCVGNCQIIICLMFSFGEPFHITLLFQAQSAGVVEYTGCFAAEE